MGKQTQASPEKPNCTAPWNTWAVRTGKCPYKKPKAPPFPGPVHTQPQAWKRQQPFLGHKAEAPGTDSHCKPLQENTREDKDDEEEEDKNKEEDEDDNKANEEKDDDKEDKDDKDRQRRRRQR